MTKSKKKVIESIDDTLYKHLELRMDFLEIEINEIKKEVGMVKTLTPKKTIKEKTTPKTEKISPLNNEIIKFIRKNGRVKTIEIAEHLGYSVPSISNHANDLYKKGKLERDNRGSRGTFFYIEE